MATLRLLQEKLENISTTKLNNPGKGTSVGTFGTTPDPYATALPSDIHEMTNKAQISLSLFARAAVSSQPLATIVTDEHVRQLLDLEDNEAVSAERRDNVCTAVILTSLKALRVATNPDKKVLPTGCVLTVNNVNLANGYSKWIQRTKNAHVIATVRSVVEAFPDSSPIETRLAAGRLLGRGFTTAGLICLLVSKINSTAGKTSLAQLIATYSSELNVVLNLVERVVATPDTYYFGFYSGITDDIGAKRYEHLGAIAYRALNLVTMKQYSGHLRNVRFPANVETHIEALVTAADEITVPDYDVGWLDVLTQAADRLRAKLPGTGT